MPRPKDECKLPVDLGGIVELWDGDQELRGYLRQGNPVFNAGGNVTVKTCRENQGILLPLLHKITGYGCKMPDVEPLRQALRDLYNKNGQPSVHYETIVKESWQIRMHLSQLKRKAKRGEVSKDPVVQDKCLILKPDLKSLVDEIRSKMPEKKQEEVEDEDGWDEDSDDETDPVQKKAKVEASNSEAVAPVQKADKETPFQTPHKSSGGSDQSTATPSASPTTAASTTTSRSSSERSLEIQASLEAARKKLEELRLRKKAAVPAAAAHGVGPPPTPAGTDLAETQMVDILTTPSLQDALPVLKECAWMAAENLAARLQMPKGI